MKRKGLGDIIGASVAVVSITAMFLWGLFTGGYDSIFGIDRRTPEQKSAMMCELKESTEFADTRCFQATNNHEKSRR